MIFEPQYVQCSLKTYRYKAVSKAAPLLFDFLRHSVCEIARACEEKTSQTPYLLQWSNFLFALLNSAAVACGEFYIGVRKEDIVNISRDDKYN